MDNYTTFKVIAEMPNGTYAKFTIYPGDNTPRPERGHTHDEAFNAESDLYVRLMAKYDADDQR